MGKNNIETLKEFQTSINIGFDLYDDEKIRKFIPTISGIKLLEEIWLSTNISSTQRARILVGAYGKGKSHLVLVILSLLFKKNREIFKNLLTKIKEYNEDFYDSVVEYLESDKKILPIVINNNGNSLKQDFLFSLEETLKKESLNKLMPETNFSSVIETIEIWEKEYPETFGRLKEKLDIPIDEFIERVRSFDLESYKQFENIYPQLTSGSRFNPFFKANIVETYEKVAIALKNRGYSGIYIVYDEFSKYLEGNIETTNMEDIKLLQDFAEKCSRSGNLQLHLMLISHKELSNYLTKNITREMIDAWQGVSGRFLEVNIQNDFEQTYEIISQVIKKDSKFWREFKKENRENFENLENNYLIKNILEESNIKFIKECYPLHPISIFILPRLSEKIAQNERTLFTFLSAEQKYTLNEYLKSNDENRFNLITPDYIFDYFDMILKKEDYNSEIYKTYKLLKIVLRKVNENSLEAKILKTIALIYIIEQFERLAPTEETIVEIFKESYSVDEIISSLNNLKEKECLVYLKLSNNYLKIKENSGVDIENEISKYINKNLLKTPFIELLNDIPYDNYLYPTRYNDENEIVRYFDFIFIKNGDIYNRNYLKIKENLKNSDGVVFGIIPGSREDIDELEKFLKEEQEDKQIVFIIPKKFKNIKQLIYKYKSIEELLKETEEDIALKEEYELILNDLQEVIFSYIDSFARPERDEASYYHYGEKKKIYRKAHLSNLLSNICEEIFFNTPIINNETINKNMLSTTTLNSRNKVVAKLLESELEENLGLKGTGQDVTIMRTLLLNSGILRETPYKQLEINLEIEDKKLKNLLDTIDNFFAHKILSKWRSFKELYDEIILPEHSIGLKRGVIPIYLAVLIHKYRKSLIIKGEEGEEKIDAELLSNINKNPEKYSVYIENWSEEKNLYLEGIYEIFEEYSFGDKNRLNNLKNQVTSMKQWYLSLPKYSKELKSQYIGNDEYRELEKKKLNFLNELRNELDNPREFLFEKLPKIFNCSALDSELLKDIRETKEYFENLIEDLKERLILDIKRIFKGNSDISLISVVKDWEEGLKSETKEHIFNKSENKVLELIEKSDNNERQFISKLGRIVSSLRLEDWSKNTVERFLTELVEIKERVEKFDSDVNIGAKEEKNSYKITFTDVNGAEQVKTFDRTDCSKRATLLYNDLLSSIDEMGESISEQEIRQILIDILEKFC